MATAQKERKIAWYRSPVSRDALAALNQRSDVLGMLQTLGHLGLLALTATAAWIAAQRGLWVLLVVFLFLHGTFYAFLLNAFHEFCHKTVFKTRFLNLFFLQMVSFLSWNNPVLFWASHQEHHKYTLHPPDDLEVVLPVKMTLYGFLKAAFINPWGLYYSLKNVIRLSLGRLEGEWENHLFGSGAASAEASAQTLRRSLFTWVRLFLLGQALLVGISFYFGWWLLPVLVTLAPFYGGGLQWLCNNTQHTGLMDNIPDFRLCCRTIYLNPFVRFLYWHMNYHTEHHMYAAVPCYRLAALHRQIKLDLPHCPNGLVEAWREIIAILGKQKTDPSYQYVAALPKK